MKIAFYTGYADCTVKENIYGSELSLMQLAKRLAKKHTVKLYTAKDKLNTADHDVIIVSRYLIYFNYVEHKDAKLVIWSHDFNLLGWQYDKPLPEHGKYLLKNCMDKVDKVVCLSPWHQGIIKERHEIPEELFTQIGHGINNDDYEDGVERIPNTLMWTSDFVRSLPETIKMLNDIKGHKLTLNVYGKDSSPSRKVDAELKKLIDTSKHDIIMHGWTSNKELIKGWQKTDIWFYPTNYYETYCITALEAQRAGCFCITSDIGALTTTVGDRGVRIAGDPNIEQFQTGIINSLQHYLDNRNDMEKYRVRAQSWANEQTLDKTANKWEEMLCDL